MSEFAPYSHMRTLLDETRERARALEAQRRLRQDQHEHDADVQRLRAERARRTGRLDPRMVEAKAAYKRLMAEEVIKGRGGRPRCKSIACGKYDPSPSLSAKARKLRTLDEKTCNYCGAVFQRKYKQSLANFALQRSCLRKECSSKARSEGITAAHAKRRGNAA